jgi:hypothetical protein
MTARFRYVDHQLLPVPRWAIICTPNPTGPGVILYASTEIDAGQLQLIIDGELTASTVCGPVTDQAHVYATLDMRRYHMIYAPDDLSALLDLINSAWRPPADADPTSPERRPALPSPARQIQGAEPRGPS